MHLTAIRLIKTTEFTFDGKEMNDCCPYGISVHGGYSEINVVRNVLSQEQFDNYIELLKTDTSSFINDVLSDETDSTFCLGADTRYNIMKDIQANNTVVIADRYFTVTKDTKTNSLIATPL